MADVHFCMPLKPLCPLASFRKVKNGSDWAMSPAIRKTSGDSCGTDVEKSRMGTRVHRQNNQLLVYRGRL
ncbi:hypothetical protein HanIR_Chr11g0528481 [Helianthus annuus]|nr:hypothetical protein HanIR_Chr11g0528481 [Helianthus annuus]